MLVYLHGFNSSPLSHKAKVLGDYMNSLGIGRLYHCPALPPEAARAIELAEASIKGTPPSRICWVGSSLGGFYATYLAERHGSRAVLINPAIDPHVGLKAYLGPQRNLHTGEPYVLAPDHLEGWRQLYMGTIDPRRYLLLVETGDEVLDYRRALDRYAGAEQVVIPGGDHSLQSFAEHLSRIVRFAGLQA
ncbi:MAG: esterase [Betaproteobacteria bacterium]|nr:esterase [Betaproteobacteria bacterium]